ncbi:MAG: AAA family ATPase [Bacteroidia bacterium]
MKITSITLHNYRAFYGTHRLELGTKGNNLLLYGENGSGKSSLFKGLELFFQGTSQDATWEQNVYMPETQSTYLELELEGQAEPIRFESPNKRFANDTIKAANKLKGFLDYRRLLRTHLAAANETVNLFEIIVKELLAHSVNSYSKNQALGELWTDIEHDIHEENQTSVVKKRINENLSAFNDALAYLLTEILKDTTTFLQYFIGNGQLNVGFVFNGVSYRARGIVQQKEIYLSVKLNDKPIKHQEFLNEARLSALAISLYLAAIKILPPDANTLKVLFLDDIFIGLDMSNRLPMLHLLKDHFSDYQVLMTTYDRNWFEVAKQMVSNDQWVCMEMYIDETAGINVPILVSPSMGYYEKAKAYFKAKDYPACLNYLRKEVERLIKERLHTDSLYSEGKPHALSHLWGLLLERYESLQYPIDNKIKETLSTIRLVLLNPHSHDTTSHPIYYYEVNKAFELIKTIQAIPIIQKKVLFVKGMNLVFQHPTENYSFEFQLVQDWYIDFLEVQPKEYKPKCRALTWQYNDNVFWDFTGNKKLAPSIIEKIISTETTFDKLLSNLKRSMPSITDELFMQHTRYENMWTLEEVMAKAQSNT